jgi:hypothetical protein
MRRKRIHLLAYLLLALLCACSSQVPARAPDSDSPPDATTTPVPAQPTPATLRPTVQGNVDVTSTPQEDISTLPPELTPYAGALQPALLGDLFNMTLATRYDIDLTIESDLQHVRGTQQVWYVNHSYDDLHEILLRLYPNTQYMGGHMQVSQVSVDGAPVTPVVYLRPTIGMSGTSGQPISDRSVLSLPLASALPPGHSVALSMTFMVSIPLQANSGYHTFGWANDVMAIPDVYPVIPVRDGAGWRVDVTPNYGDVAFSEVSLYRVHIHSPSDLVLVSTGVCTSVVDRPVNSVPTAFAWRDTECVAAPVRDFAIHASRQYQVISATLSTTAGNLLVSSYYMPQYALTGQRALDYAMQAVQNYERRYGPYPYKELKIFASPNTSGGIEYPMLAGVTDSLYAKDDDYFRWITAHEVAHQWWYGMVGSDPINEAWLDESLTQYSSSLFIEDRYGVQAADADRQLYFSTRYERELKAGRDVPVAQSTGAFERSTYAPIVYGKGPLFFDAVRRAVGDERYTAWLRVYFIRYRYRIVHAEDLLMMADETGIGAAVRQAYSQWILSAGRP